VDDLLHLDGDDQPHLVAAAEPRVRPAEVPVGQLVDVLRATLGGDADDPAAHREVGGDVGRVGDRHGDPGITLDVPDLLEARHGVDQYVLAVGADPGLGELW
jgi:hypothetical protein